MFDRPAAVVDVGDSKGEPLPSALIRCWYAMAPGGSRHSRRGGPPRDTT
jgi:hypothetical protein